MPKYIEGEKLSLINNDNSRTTVRVVKPPTGKRGPTAQPIVKITGSKGDFEKGEVIRAHPSRLAGF